MPTRYADKPLHLPRWPPTCPRATMQTKHSKSSNRTVRFAAQLNSQRSLWLLLCSTQAHRYFTPRHNHQSSMQSVKNCLLAVTAALTLGVSSVNAHGQLTLPAPTFSGYGGGVAATIDVKLLPVPTGMTYSAGPD